MVLSTQSSKKSWQNQSPQRKRSRRVCKSAKTKADSENSWSVAIKDVDLKTYDLSAKNPNKNNEQTLREPKEILEEMRILDLENKDILDKNKSFHGLTPMVLV